MTSRSLAAGERDIWPEDDWDPKAAMDARISAVDAGRYELPPERPVEGLFVCLPAEDTDVAGFAIHGAMDTTLPGPLLAAAIHAITGEDGQGLASLSDDQLIEVIDAARRMEARTAWTLDLLQERDSRTRSPDPGPSIAVQVTITVPAGTALGRGALPGEVGGFGLLDAPATRDLMAAAARHPDTRWCVTALHPDGTAAAHGCAAGRHLIPEGRAGPGPPADQVQDPLRKLTDRLTSIARGHCDHSRAETGYKPSRKLEHLVNTRNARCLAPGCGRPAARCDKDHTVAWLNGGLTCECKLAPTCKR